MYIVFAFALSAMQQARRSSISGQEKLHIYLLCAAFSVISHFIADFVLVRTASNVQRVQRVQRLQRV